MRRLKFQPSAAEQRRKVKPPRRDLIEVLPQQYMSKARLSRGQFFRVWINGVEATSVRRIEGTCEPVTLRYSQLTDPLGSDVTYAYTSVAHEFAAPRIRHIKKPRKRSDA